MAAYLYMLLLAVVMLGLAAIFTGWGLILRQLLNQKDLSFSGLAVAPLLGWCLTLAVFQIWHLFLPVTALLPILIAGVGIAGLALNITVLWALACRRMPRLIVFTAILCGLAFWMAMNTTRQPWNYDSGLYHLNSIRWANTYPVVPGLANLHGRLGFNSSFFLYAATLNVGPFAGKCHHLANGTLFLMSLVPCLGGLFAVVRRGVRIRTHQLYYALFTIPVVAWSMNPSYITSPSPDAAVFLIGMILGGELLQLLGLDGEHLQAEAHPETAVNRALVVLLLTFAGATVKLSFVELGGAAIIAVCAGFFSKPGWRITGQRMLTLSAIAGILFLVPWMIHGVILSGYIAFPMAVGGIPVDWKASASATENQMVWIESWARLPSVDYRQVLGNWDWLLPWSHRMASEYPFDVILPLVLTGSGFLWMLIRRIRKDAAVSSGYWLFLVPPAVGLVVWFFAAPAPRFAGACFWIPAIGTMAVFLQPVRKCAVQIAAVVLLAVAGCSMVDLVRFYRASPRDTGPVKTVPMKTMNTDSGLKAYVPCEVDRCWDAPLPCTPYLYPDLRLRDSTDMSKGFTFQPQREGR